MKNEVDHYRQHSHIQRCQWRQCHHAAAGYTVISKEVEIMADRFRQHIPLKTHNHNLKRYEKTFSGREAVDFMVDSNMAATRHEALELGTDFLHTFRIMQHVNGNHHHATFHDDHRLLYCLTSETKLSMKDMKPLKDSIHDVEMITKVECDDEYEDAALDVGMILTRGLLIVAGLAMLWGRPAIAASMSCLCMLLLVDLPTDKRHRLPRFSAIDQYLLVSLLCTEASLGSWGILSWMAYVGKNTDADSVWVNCKILQKLAGILVIAVIGIDMNLKSKPQKQKQESDPLTGQKRQDDLATTEIQITLLEGRNLVPKDQNIFGKFTTSDPYVVIKYGNDEFGRSHTIRKTLNPKFTKNDVFTLHVHPGTLNRMKLECHIFDFDFSSDDDSMGVVTIPLPVCTDMDSTSWYPVEKGKGVYYCEDASGELKVNVQVKHPPNLYNASEKL